VFIEKFIFHVGKTRYLTKVIKIMLPSFFRKYIIGRIRKIEKQALEFDGSSFRGDSRIDSYKSNIWKTPDIASGFVRASKEFSSLLMDSNINQVFLRELNEKGLILDLGSGHGQVSKFLINNSSTVISLDSSEILMKQFFKRRRQSKRPIVGDAFNLPFKEQSFDFIVSRMFIYHFENWQSILSEASRVTKNGGIVQIHFPCIENVVTKRSDLSTNNLADYISTPTIKEIGDTALKHNLKLDKITPVQFFHTNYRLNFQDNNIKYFYKYRKVRDFITYFDNNVTNQMKSGDSFWNIILFKKIN
jgi:ubiquinone/menaquinone biosynthesis C-methylase UbiE